MFLYSGIEYRILDITNKNDQQQEVDYAFTVVCKEFLNESSRKRGVSSNLNRYWLVWVELFIGNHWNELRNKIQ